MKFIEIFPKHQPQVNMKSAQLRRRLQVSITRQTTAHAAGKPGLSSAVVNASVSQYVDLNKRQKCVDIKIMYLKWFYEDVCYFGC